MTTITGRVATGRIVTTKNGLHLAFCERCNYLSVPQASRSDALDRLSAHEAQRHGKDKA